MLRYALMICLFLLSSGVRSELINSHKTTNLEEEKSFEHYMISPDTYADTHLVAQYEKIAHQNPQKINVKLSLYAKGLRPVSENCSFILKAETDEWGITSLRRASETKVILTWKKLTSNELYPNTELIVYDMASCGEIRLTSNLKTLRDPVIVPEGHDQFSVFVDDTNSCGNQFPKCWIQYDLKTSSHKIYPFTIDLDWKSLQMDRLKTEYLLVQGTYRENNSRAVFLMSPHRVQRVMELANGLNREINVVSADMSFCWITNPGTNTEVQCKQLKEDGTEFFTKTLMFEEPITLVDARSPYEGEITLFSKKVKCNGERHCRGLWVTSVNENRTYDNYAKQVRVLPMCDDPEKITIFNVQMYLRVTLNFGCKIQSKFYFAMSPVPRSYDAKN